METIHTQYKHCDVIKVKGRIDSATAPNFGAALTSLTDQGRYHIVDRKSVV